jgi:hypothetical protein
VRIASICGLAAVALIACKADKADVPTATASGSGSAAAVVVPAKISGSLGSMIPTLPTAKVLSTKAPNDAYALATWCIDEPDAIELIMAALRRDGWTDVRSRGEPPRRSIAGMKGDIRFSARTGGSDTRCAGTYAVATVMRLGNLDAKLLEGADKIR